MNPATLRSIRFVSAIGIFTIMAVLDLHHILPSFDSYCETKCPLQRIEENPVKERMNVKDSSILPDIIITPPNRQAYQNSVREALV